VNHGISLAREFFKGHGHGNDYLVFEAGEAWPVTSESVASVCHRQRGVGGDGIVALLSGVEERPSQGRLPVEPGAPFLLRMFNPDGSEFERSGNGLRILGAYLYSRGWVGLGESVSVEVGGDGIELKILGEDPQGVIQVSANMGDASFGMAAVGGTDRWEVSEGTLVGPDGEELRVHPVSVGNPHCVVFRNDLPLGDLLRLGPFLTTHPAFPAGINVQLARVVGSQRVEILIWERGVGQTSSSGTSACAVAAASVREGLLSPGRVAVEMEGGSFTVAVSPNMVVRLEGPVEPLCTGELTDGFLRQLRQMENSGPSGSDPDEEEEAGDQETKVG
jgi:diaminopimelate epimerase